MLFPQCFGSLASGFGLPATHSSIPSGSVIIPVALRPTIDAVVEVRWGPNKHPFSSLLGQVLGQRAERDEVVTLHQWLSLCSWRNPPSHGVFSGGSFLSSAGMGIR